MKNPIFPLLFGLVLYGICQAQPTKLNIDRNAGITRINLQGELNRDYRLEASDLSFTNWNFLSTLSLFSSSQSWFDSTSASMPSRFYRAVQVATNQLGRVFEYADDFRLIDHQGTSRSLYYLENDATVKGVVLIFTGNSCLSVAQMVPTIKALRNQFTPQG